MTITYTCAILAFKSWLSICNERMPMAVEGLHVRIVKVL